MIKLQAYFTRFGSRQDKSASLSFETQELGPEAFASFQQAQGEFGWLVFQSNPINDSDIPKEQAEDTQKTPSKRLRSVLFIKWTQEGATGDFEAYYRAQVEKIITHIKSKLD